MNDLHESTCFRVRLEALERGEAVVRQPMRREFPQLPCGRRGERLALHRLIQSKRVAMRRARSSYAWPRLAGSLVPSSNTGNCSPKLQYGTYGIRRILI